MCVCELIKYCGVSGCSVLAIASPGIMPEPEVDKLFDDRLLESNPAKKPSSCSWSDMLRRGLPCGAGGGPRGR